MLLPGFPPYEARNFPVGSISTIVAVIPARDEAEGVGETVRSLLLQDYPGAFSIVLVDDESTDDTAGVTRRAAEGHEARLTVLPGAPRPKGHGPTVRP